MLAIQAFVAIWVAGVAVAQRNKYYNINDMPLTNFDCRDKILGGYYADPEVNCQMFHVCVKTPGQGVQDFRFLCPNGTVFDQEQQICADSGDIDCASSGLFFENFDLYRLGTAPASKPRPTFGFVSRNTPIPLGPSTQSPILSNSVADDDDFYLQRSETGDRRLHSKDLLRGSSSSNLFNSRNGGKDLDDDEDVDTPRNINQTPQSYRPKPSQQSRGKSQYNTQFRRTEPTTTSTTVSSPTSTTTTPIPPRQQEEKKRTKVAVRKLARKRPTTPDQVQSTPATFTTQVTQKLTFGDPIDQRYSTINRAPASPSSPFPQQPNRQYQQNLRARTESTTAAAQINYQQQQQLNRGTTFQPSYQPQAPTTPDQASPSFHQAPAQPSTAFQQNYRQNEPSSTPAFFEPSGAPTPRPGGFHGRPIVADQTYQSPQPSSTQAPQTRSPTQQFSYNQNRRPQNQFRQNSPQSRPTQPPNQNFNTQQPTQQFNSAPAVPQNNQPFDSQKNKQFQQKNTQQLNVQPKKQQATTQFNPQNNQYTPQPKQQFNSQYSQQTNQQFSSQPKQYTPQPTQAQQYTPQPTHSAQNNQQYNAQPQFDSQPNQQYNSQNNQYTPQTQQFNQQGVRVTASPTPQTRAPANLPVVRAQTINAALQPQSTSLRPFNPVDDFEDNDQQEFLKTAQSSNFRPSDINSFSNTYKSGGEKAAEVTKAPTTKYYTPTIITTPKPAAPSTTQAPRPSAPPAPIAPSSKNKDQDKGDYDYAYYDDGNTFSEYDALDALGEQDFSRTSQRSKSRLI